MLRRSFPNLEGRPGPFEFSRASALDLQRNDHPRLYPLADRLHVELAAPFRPGHPDCRREKQGRFFVARLGLVREDGCHVDMTEFVRAGGSGLIRRKKSRRRGADLKVNPSLMLLWKGERDGGSATFLAGDGGGSAMQLGNRLDQSEAEAAAGR